MNRSSKLQVTYDRQGVILSAYRVPDTWEGAALRTGVVPDVAGGIRAAELEVPAQFAALELPQLAERLRVDIHAEQPRLIACERDSRSD
jgi:hypothetical protein